MGSVTGSQEDISQGLIHYGGLLVMLSGAGLIIGCVLGIVLDSKIAMVLSIAEFVLSLVGFIIGLVVWGSGWILREE